MPHSTYDWYNIPITILERSEALKSKKGINLWILIIVIGLGVYIGTTDNNNSKTSPNSVGSKESSDPYEYLRSDKKHTLEEDVIKKAADKYMIENFGSVIKTSWFDSIKGTRAVINKTNKTFIIQSKGESYDVNAEKFMSATLGFFNDKTLELNYRVDRVTLVDRNYNIIKEAEIIKW